MNNKLLSTLLLSLLVITGLTFASDNKTAHEAFRGGAVEDQEHWYRELRFDDWTEMGVSEETIKAALTRIEANHSSELKDADNSHFLPGYWTYEFYKSAQKKESNISSTKSRLDLLKLQNEVTALYLIGSYPNLRQPHELLALDKAVNSYIKAIEFDNRLNVEKVKLPLLDGTFIPALLHKPAEVYDKKLPAVMWSGGVDKTMIEHKKSILPLIQEGYIVLTFDMPGAGLDYKNALTPGKEAINHMAAFRFLSNHSFVDNQRIGALSSSGAGISLIEFAMREPKLKAVVARCALVAGPLNRKATLKYIPEMSAHSLVARMGGDVGDTEFIYRYAEKLSLENKGYFDGEPKINTPLLAINTYDDPVAPPHDVKRTAQLSSQGKALFFGDLGHCPEGDEPKQAIYQFLQAHLSPPSGNTIRKESDRALNKFAFK